MEEGKWIIFKKKILEKWHNVSHEDLEAHRTTPRKIIDLILRRHPEDRSTVEKYFHEIFGGREELEKYYEEHPSAPRTSEISEFQDEAKDILTRSKERAAFEQNIENQS